MWVLTGRTRATTQKYSAIYIVYHVPSYIQKSGVTLATQKNGLNYILSTTCLQDNVIQCIWIHTDVLFMFTTSLIGTEKQDNFFTNRINVSQCFQNVFLRLPTRHSVIIFRYIWMLHKHQILK